jgi:hypothetical protein
MSDLTIPLILLAHKALEMGPRKYAPHPAADEPREEEPVEPRDAAEFFAAEQCPSDATFR